MSLPPGWTQRIAPDGRLYYQNHTTKETSWNAPLTPTIAVPQQQHRRIAPLQIMNQTSNINDIVIERKIWHKEHMIWLFFFCILFYDLYADVQVAIAWTDLQSLCPQFKCHTLMDFLLPMNVLSGIMLTVSIIGFLVGLILKILDAISLYNIYTNPIAEKQILRKSLLTDYKRTMRYGWITPIMEDAISMILIIAALGQGVANYVGLRGKYIQSLLTSVVFGSIVTLYGFFKHRKYKNVVLNEQEAWEIEWARNCHKCWCCCVMALISLMGYITMGYVLVYGHLGINTPLIELKLPNENAMFDVQNRCEYFGYSGSVNESYQGQIIQAPQEIFDGCSGNNYDYMLRCVPDRSDEFASCTLRWNYDHQKEIDTVNDFNCDIADISSIVYGIDECKFDIYVGFCGNLTIECNNAFEFEEGNPTMWACIDYCDDE